MLDSGRIEKEERPREGGRECDQDAAESAFSPHQMLISSVVRYMTNLQQNDRGERQDHADKNVTLEEVVKVEVVAHVAL